MTILNDILDFSKIEAGKPELDPFPFSLHETLDGVMKTLAFRAKEKKIALRCMVTSETPDALIGDSGCIRQILINLIGNALKFTEHGEVVVEVKCYDEETGAWRLVLCSRKWGGQVVVANHGKEALLLLAQEGPFDVILMDCQMPEMDGFEATVAICRQKM